MPFFEVYIYQIVNINRNIKTLTEQKAPWRAWSQVTTEANFSNNPIAAAAKRQALAEYRVSQKSQTNFFCS